MALGSGAPGAGVDDRVQAVTQVAATMAAWRVRNVKPGSRTRRDIA
jgi:hypothetical protein